GKALLELRRQCALDLAHQHQEPQRVEDHRGRPLEARARQCADGVDVKSRQLRAECLVSRLQLKECFGNAILILRRVRPLELAELAQVWLNRHPVPVKKCLFVSYAQTHTKKKRTQSKKKVRSIWIKAETAASLQPLPSLAHKHWPFKRTKYAYTYCQGKNKKKLNAPKKSGKKQKKKEKKRERNATHKKIARSNIVCFVFFRTLSPTAPIYI
ncbi:hypothetical protein TCSYLVIO_003445, partial [Trypanosoma cruzi]